MRSACRAKGLSLLKLCKASASGQNVPCVMRGGGSMRSACRVKGRSVLRLYKASASGQNVSMRGGGSMRSACRTKDSSDINGAGILGNTSSIRETP